MVQIEGLAKSFRGRHVLSGVALMIEQGEVLGLLGPNGAGKTTLVNILSTLLPPDGGSVRVAGFDVRTQADRVRDAISLTGQYAAVDDLLTGAENLRLMCRLAGLDAQATRIRTAELLEQFGLTAAAGRLARTYSGGMRRRLDIAVSLIRRPRLLILDEPTTGLDPASRQDVWRFVRVLAAEGVTILLTTQYLEEADRLADRVAVLDEGRIVHLGTPEEIKSHVGSALLELTSPEGEPRAMPVDSTVEGLSAALGQLRAEGLGRAEVRLRTPSLDDAFLALTRKETSS